MNANTIYLGAHFTAPFFMEWLARFLRNILAQLEATEVVETRLRHIASDRNCTQTQATEQLHNGETLQHEAHDDEDKEGSWWGKSARPRFELDTSIRDRRTRLLLARAALENLLKQCETSRNWQGAVALQREHDEANYQQLQLQPPANVRVMYPDAPGSNPERRPPVIEIVVHVAELIAVLELLANLNVDPHTER